MSEIDDPKCGVQGRGSVLYSYAHISLFICLCYFNVNKLTAMGVNVLGEHICIMAHSPPLIGNWNYES